MQSEDSLEEACLDFRFSPGFAFSSCCRLGFTYLRLKDNYMEILNRENDIER